MRITNITDIAKGTGVKVIGVGPYRIMPGETVEVPDSFVYVGNHEVLPAILALTRTNQLRFEETPSVPDVSPYATENVSNEENENNNVQDEPEVSCEDRKKAEAAAKRAAARAANKAKSASEAGKA